MSGLAWLRRPAAAAVLCAAALSLFFPSASAAFKHISDGMSVPEFEGTDLQSGEKFRVEASGIEGQLTVVVFWATWSRRSIALLGDLDSMSKALDGHPLRIVAVNVEAEEIEGEVRERVESFVQQSAYSFPVHIDEQLSIFHDFGVIAIPSTAIVDHEGVLLRGPAGYSPLIKDEIHDVIEQALGIAPAEPTEQRIVYRPSKDSGRRYGLALRLSKQGRPERALKQVDRAIEADPRFPAPHVLRGDLLMFLDRNAEALLAYEKACELDGQSIVALAGWGAALLATGEVAAAGEKLEAALEIEASYTPALLDLARCRISESHYEDAIRTLDTAVELNPNDPLIHEAFGHAYRGLGRTAAAIEAFRHALDLRYPAP